ncbi:hypothetical protein [Brevundimonas denitrificans]|uniref:hypothetical protein n=1 Tax=Brevundimonas denitrificans TaxID=1443434 RepID=UPI00223C18D5|nr:hypothetical protein [Brevundimonas denitrificans]
MPDAVRLNDLYVTEAGVAYVTDSGTDTDPGALYRIQPDGTVERSSRDRPTCTGSTASR